jgi:hypothetical protein
MAVDPAMVGFNVVDNLQNTLLSYVMQNRKMQQQDRQFYSELGQRASEFDRTFGEGQRQFDTTFDEGQRRYDTTLDEETRRFDLGEAARQRQEALESEMRRVDSIAAQGRETQKMSKKAQESFDRSRKEYIENMKDVNLGTGALFRPDYWKSLFAPSPEQYYGEQFDARVGSRPSEFTPTIPTSDLNVLPSSGFTNQILADTPNKETLLRMLMLQQQGG